MTGLDIRVFGADALVRRLERTADRAAAEVRVHLSEIAAETAAEAKARVLAQREPERPLPSTLADSIEVVEEAEESLVLARAPHAVFVEFGTVRMAAEPFLALAFDAAVEELRRCLPAGGGR